jgi:predicted  nucleic acid-binding Zn-ribbon protein
MNRLDVLWQLQELDLDLDEMAKKLLEAQSKLGESADLVQAREAVLETKTRLQETRRGLRDGELELKGLSSRIQITEDRLYGGLVTNPKELTNLQQEQQYLKQKQSDLEDSILQTMTEDDEQESLLKRQSQILEQVENAWREEQAELVHQIGELGDRQETLTTKRGELVAILDAESLQIYEELRHKKGGRALGSLRGDLCEACRESNPTSKVQLAKRRSELVFCGGCGRILYVG